MSTTFSDVGHSKNPNYKTALCQNYMSGLYCSFADKCGYAHGKHELREKPASLPPGLLIIMIGLDNEQIYVKNISPYLIFFVPI